MRLGKYSSKVFIAAIAISLPFIVGMIQAPQFLLDSNTTPTPGLTPTAIVEATPDNSSCLLRTNIADVDAGWTYIPTNASQLYTEDNLQWLAGRLISSKVVDASSCPAGGLGLNGYANACGMTIAKPIVVNIQNSLNQAILDQYKDVGVPPVLLKQLISTESQFWPSQEVPGHYGLGQVTNIGAANALKQNPELLAIVCGSSTNNCIPDDSTVEMLFEQMVNTCPTCQNGINADQANHSVVLLSKVILSYCKQTAQLVFNATGWRSNLVVDYGTLWKLTLMDYNAGGTCVFNSMRDAFKRTKGPVDWPNIVAVTSDSLCTRGIYYANIVTRNDFGFPPKQ